MSVLLVITRPSLAEMYQIFLEKYGHTVHHFLDANTASNFVSDPKNKVDIAIVDSNLKFEGEGTFLTHTLQGMFADPEIHRFPTILMASSNIDESRHRATHFMLKNSITLPQFMDLMVGLVMTARAPKHEEATAS